MAGAPSFTFINAIYYIYRIVTQIRIYVTYISKALIFIPYIHRTRIPMYRTHLYPHFCAKPPRKGVWFFVAM